MKEKKKEDHKIRTEEKAFDLRIISQDYFLHLEESWKYEREEEKTNTMKLWFYEIRGKQGFIFSYSETTLGAIVFQGEGVEKIRVSKKDKEIKIYQKFDGEIMLEFFPSYLDKVCSWIKVQKKRKIGEKSTS